ncbi:MAG: YbhB/YbcL family Raf kinase inhibitor-like protein [Proteobacteria bacterium]|nr:YbhB/YbcL family Raf kinase inhibitor-like protein [Pseudomonadota bacterium]
MASASPSAAGFELKSAEFADGDYLANEQVFAGFGCEGKNVSPSLSWSGAPADTKSFALNVYDPDAPTGSGWWHWVVVNMPPPTTGLQKGTGSSVFSSQSSV